MFHFNHHKTAMNYLCVFMWVSVITAWYLDNIIPIYCMFAAAIALFLVVLITVESPENKPWDGIENVIRKKFSQSTTQEKMGTDSHLFLSTTAVQDR